MKIYCISDTHFGHEKLHLEWGRPEHFSEKLMGSFLKGCSCDLLIHCGDFCIGNDEEWHKRFMEVTDHCRRKVLVTGNHDKKSDLWYYGHGWDFVCRQFYAKYLGKKIIFSHRPLEERNEFDFNVHGHLHGNDHRSDDVKSVVYNTGYHRDLAPELWGYRPVRLEEVIK